MGIYNELILMDNPQKRIQFKYGFCRLLEYRIGDVVIWKNIIKPEFAKGKVIVSGIADGLNLGDYSYFAIEIVDDKIVSAKEISEEEWKELEKKDYSKV